MLIRVPRSSLQKISHNSVQEILLQKISHKFSLFCSHVLLSPWWHTGKDQSFIFPPERWLCFMEKSQNTPWIINDWFHFSKHCCLSTYIKSRPTSSFFHFSNHEKASLSAQTVLLVCGGSGNHYQTVGATNTTQKTVWALKLRKGKNGIACHCIALKISSDGKVTQILNQCLPRAPLA